MSARDLRGEAVSGATAEGLARYEEALALLQIYRVDPLAKADAAIAAAPAMPMAYALKAWLLLLGTEGAALPAAREAWRAAEALEATPRERGHLRAIGALLEGRWHEAGRALEEVAIAHPRDVLALQAGHQLDFFTGNARMLRDRIARALPAWHAGLPGFHALLGMHAFGLEECGDYARAEASGWRALELEPRDGWAKHAVAHVYEMQARHEAGIAWLRADPANWAADSFLAVHNWWHLALFHLDLGEVDEALWLYDGPIAGPDSAIALELIDRSALLWRLHLRGASPGERWAPLAARWAPFAADGRYAFNDLHAAIAFIGAGDARALESLLEAQAEAMRAPGDNAAFTREVGHPAVQALLAFAGGDYARAGALLREVRPVAHRFGGSHAQRDLIDLTLIESALRSGERALAGALVAERAALRPASPPTRALVARLQPPARDGSQVPPARRPAFA